MQTTHSYKSFALTQRLLGPLNPLMKLIDFTFITVGYVLCYVASAAANIELGAVCSSVSRVLLPCIADGVRYFTS